MRGERTASAQTKHSAPKAPTVTRGSSAELPAKKVAAKPVAAKAAMAHSANRPSAKPSKQPQPQVRATRYGGFMLAPPPPPPSLDTTSPRTLSLVNVHTDEALVVTYWSDGAYRRDALDKLNHFLRDSREGAETEMDPLLFDVLWHTALAERVPPHMLSRVTSYDWMGSLALLPIGYVLAGPLGEAFGAAEVLAVGSALALAALTLAFTSREVRQMAALASR